jgi:heterodisulfide reductase subunit C
MIDFGYSRVESTCIDLDKHNDSLLNKLVKKDSDILTCMACGSCTASCTAGVYLSMSLRKVILHTQRGNVQEEINQTAHCMFCGKCILVCPRGINTRPLLTAIRTEAVTTSKI